MDKIILKVKIDDTNYVDIDMINLYKSIKELKNNKMVDFQEYDICGYMRSNKDNVFIELREYTFDKSKKITHKRFLMSSDNKSMYAQFYCEDLERGMLLLDINDNELDLYDVYSTWGIFENKMSGKKSSMNYHGVTIDTWNIKNDLRIYKEFRGR